MRCCKCNKSIPDNSKFCNFCGAKQIGKIHRMNKYYVRPDGLHECMKNINGKRYVFRGKTDAEVDRQMLEWKEATENGRKFKDVAEEWWDIHTPQLAHNTICGYKASYSRAISEFGDRYIHGISAKEVQQYINEFSIGGRSKKVVTTQLQILHMIFDYAVVSGDIEFNPCASVQLKSNLPKTYRQAASEDDEAAVKANPDVWLFPYFILYTGMRKGEALAIQFRDIDLKKGRIRVTKSVYHVEGGRPEIKTPKTLKGTRVVPLLDPLREHLPTGAPDDYLFSTDGGKAPLRRWEFNNIWAKWQKELGVTCTAHMLRHSYATMLLECGIAPKVRQELLGHANISTTQDVYEYIRDGYRDDEIEQLQAYVSKAAE